MVRLSLLPVILREVFGTRDFSRVPEPDLIMEDSEQVKAYSESGRAEGLMAAAYLFHTAQALATLSKCTRVLDLGCGPATQLAQIAALRPDIEFVGMDLSSEMLRWGREHIADLGLRNVQLVQGDITKLEAIRDHEFDGVMSTLTLHHLPEYDMLKACFAQVSRVLKPGGAVYIADFGRLKTLKSVTFFAYMNADRQPQAFTQDYEYSLRAAFSVDEFREASAGALPAQARIYSSFIVPILVLMQTPVSDLSADIALTLQKRRLALPDRYRADLDELRKFFRMGGLPYDPYQTTVRADETKPKAKASVAVR